MLENRAEDFYSVPQQHLRHSAVVYNILHLGCEYNKATHNLHGKTITDDVCLTGHNTR